ncbi:MAG: hypothetical protein ACFB00_11320 [Parvularculaceae bacterium]
MTRDYETKQFGVLAHFVNALPTIAAIALVAVGYAKAVGDLGVIA